MGLAGAQTAAPVPGTCGQHTGDAAHTLCLLRRVLSSVPFAADVVSVSRGLARVRYVPGAAVSTPPSAPPRTVFAGIQDSSAVPRLTLHCSSLWCCSANSGCLVCWPLTAGHVPGAPGLLAQNVGPVVLMLLGEQQVRGGDWGSSRRSVSLAVLPSAWPPAAGPDVGQLPSQTCLKTPRLTLCDSGGLPHPRGLNCVQLQ